MSLVTKAAFAAMHGVSKPAVQKWETKGWLVFTGKLVDVEASNEKLAKYRDSTDSRAAAKSKPAGKPTERLTAGLTSNQTVSVLDDETPADAAERIIISMGAEMTMEEARRVKENYLALLNKLKYQQDSGALIDLELARSVVFEEFRAMRDAWLNWPANFSALIAADLGVEADKVTEVLTGYVHKQTASLGEPEGRFVKG